MELGLSLGNREAEIESDNNLGFCMGLGLKGSSWPIDKLGEDHPHHTRINLTDEIRREKAGSSSDPSLCLHLRFTDNLSSEPGSSDGGPGSRAAEAEEQSSPNSGTSSFMEFSLYTKTGKREMGEMPTNSRGSDEEEENGSSTRKKLRLSKQQSAFLEESFKEHHTLNPKQKVELAKELNLRPRQIEVWFQNRRARTKLKQTEVDCEYLKRCCEKLTEDNRRLQKELQELRALKTSQPFFMNLPATTLTMCPSCERVAPTVSSSTAPAASDSNTTLSLGKRNPLEAPLSQVQHTPS